MSRNTLFHTLYSAGLLLAAALPCALLLACAQPHPRGEAAPLRMWPPPPLPARIVATGSATIAEDFGIMPGFWGTIWQKISGGKPAGIERPHGIHADCRKRVLVVDTVKKGVHLFDRERGEHAFIGAGDQPVFTLPIGVTEDMNNVAYITDAAAGKVFRCDLAERVPREFVSGLKRPTGITYNPVNRLVYVADTLAGQIVAFDLKGKEALRFGKPGQGKGEFNHPTDLAVGPQGKICVTDALNTRVQIFSTEGAFIRAFGEAGNKTGFFAKPKGIAVNSEGHIYVCDALIDTVQVFDQEGRLLLAFGTAGSGTGEFWMPSGIAIDKYDNIYVADTYNKRIQVFSYVWLD